MNEIQSTEIKQLELEINFYKGQAVQSIFEIGERLIKAKELIDHGNWEKWLEGKVDFSIRQAQKFMQVANEFSNTKAITHLNQTKIFTLLALPKEEIESFIEENPVEDMTTRELRQAIKEKKELEKQLNESKHKQNDLLEENRTLKNKKPEVIEKEVTPDDYKYYQESTEKFYRLQDEVRDLKKEYEEKVNESYELKQQIKQLAKTDSKEQHREKLKDNALIFATRIHTFLNDVGGLAWLTDYIAELDDYDKRSYIKAIDLLEGWVLTVKSNINKEEF